jgi:hypothetical protein
VIGISKSSGHALWRALEELSSMSGLFITSHNVQNEKAIFTLVIDIKSYERPFFDWSLLIMYIIAIFSLVMASFYSSTQERKKYQRVMARNLLPTDGRSHHQSTNGTDADDNSEDDEEDDGSHADSLPPPEYLDSTAASLFVVFASISLFILFFFLKYLIYIILFSFCIGAAQGMTVVFISIFRTWCLSPLTLSTYSPSRRHRQSVQNQIQIPLIGRVSSIELISFSLAASISVIWFLFRKTNTAWILQDRKLNSNQSVI